VKHSPATSRLDQRQGDGGDEKCIPVAEERPGSEEDGAR
jgi:hypothetical protein